MGLALGSMNFEALCTFGTDKARRGKGSRVDSNCSRKEKPVNDRKKRIGCSFTGK